MRSRVEQPQVLLPLGGVGEQLADPAVERHQANARPDRQRQQAGIGDLAVAEQPAGAGAQYIGKTEIQRQEPMLRMLRGRRAACPSQS